MAFESVTPNMGLIQPGVGLTAGPQYASDLNASLTIIDNHNHTPGSGVQITPAGLDISTDLSIQSNNLTFVNSVQLNNLLSLPTTLGAVYESGGNLYFNSATDGFQVQITAGHNVNAGSGSITGLVSPASASYVSGTQTFVWQSDVNISANMDMGSVILRNLTTSSTGITISPPSSLPGSYTITLPSTVSAANGSIMQMSTAGVMTNVLTVDNSTIKITANQLVAQKSAIITPGSITGTDIAAATISVANQVARPVSSTASVDGIAVSSASGTFSSNSTSFVDVTNLTVTITTSGRPVMLMLQSDGSSNVAMLGTNAGAGSFGEMQFVRASTTLAVHQFWGAASTNGVQSGIASAFRYLNSGLVAGTYTFKVQARSSSGGGNTVQVRNCVLVAYEI